MMVKLSEPTDDPLSARPPAQGVGTGSDTGLVKALKSQDEGAYDPRISSPAGG
jgi:hypothetical protein